MGFILFQSQYQYEQYRDRVLAKCYEPFPFLPVQKITPLNIYKEHKLIKQMKKTNDKKQKIITEKIYSETTGIGLHFNQLI